jgi:pimeloyl-ACP methyl ester carboxylesterase
VLALADAAGAERVDVVGHDWGAALAWDLAVRHPDRVRSVAAFSVPHPAALAEALHHFDQLRHSWYMAAIQVPIIPELLLGARHGALLCGQLERSGLDPASARRYARRARPRAWSGPLGWYRGLPFDLDQALPAVEVPALFAWGDGDRFITRRAAEGCAAWMHGPARCETLPGVSHWIPEVAAEQATGLLVEHLGSVAH